jgi:hypothetical protein
VNHRFTGADSKACFTLFAMCAADGSRFPLILVTKRRTERCDKQFGSLGCPHEVWHSSSGWCHEGSIVGCLAGLRNWFPDGAICCIMDPFSAHGTDQVLSTAAELMIEIIWVPEGAMRLYLPLDRRVFGALKSKGRAKWRCFYAHNY